MADDNDGAAAKPRRTPPYIAFSTLKTLFDEFKKHGVPGRIDRSVLTRFSGGVGGQLVAALRFLELIDEASIPTQALRDLCAAYQTDQWVAALRSMLKRAYSPVFNVQLETASPSQFLEVFRKAFPAPDETFRKCVTFFLNAAREAEVSISPFILKGAKPRRGPPKKPRKAKFPPADEPLQNPDVDNGDNGGGKHLPTAQVTKSEADMLVGLLDPDVMTTEEQQAVFTLLLFLKKSKKTATDQ